MVGLTEVDAQHKELFDIATEIFELFNAHLVDKYDNVMLVFDKLKNYAILHFAHEEELMLKYQYSGYNVHFEVHQQFLETVDSTLLGLNEDTDEEILKNILIFVIEWISDHILKMDKAMADSIKKLQSKS